MSIPKLVGQCNPITPDFDKIPDILRQRHHFVTWMREPRSDGKVGKVPYNAQTHRKARSNDPSTWATFDQARQAYERGGWDGIGYMLTPGTILLDADHCIDQSGQLDPRAIELLHHLNSAAEYSPSGDGVHIYLCGHLPTDAGSRYHYKGLPIEIYETGRYTTLTGRPLPDTPADLQERTAELAILLAQCSTGEDENTGGGGGARPRGKSNAIDQAQARTAPKTGKVPAAPREQAGRLRIVPPGAGLANAARPLSESDLSSAERAILAKMQAAKNSATIFALWDGGDPRDRRKADGSLDTSAGDFDLALLLGYWANDNREQIWHLIRSSPRYRPEKGAAYWHRTIDKAITKRMSQRRSQTPEPDPAGPGGGPRRSAEREPEARQPKHRDRRIVHSHPWQRTSETPEQRRQILESAALRVASLAESHIRSGRDLLQVIAVPPGVGKTHSVSELGVPGSDLKLSWVAERRDMAAQVPALQSYRMIQPCTAANCPDHLLHNGLAALSRNTMSVHKRHAVPCNYLRQFNGSESAIFQLAHVKTRHVANAAGIVVDELDLSKWLPERAVSMHLIQAALKVYGTDTTEDQFLRQVEAVITDCMQSKRRIHGRAFFEALNARCGGRLRNWLGEMYQDGRNTDTHPWTELEETDSAAQQWEVQSMAPVVLPHILVAMYHELVKWESGAEWNSLLRVGTGDHGWALYITEPLRFHPDKEGYLPSRVVLDATAPDAEILGRVLGEQVEIKREQISPPPGTRHIAVRTGKRYGLTSLKTQPHSADGTPLPNKYLLRTAAELRHFLRELDPDGELAAEQSIGLVTFKACEQELGDELGIPEHRRLHFWAARGSNQLADCPLLLVVGTPQQNPESVARLARAIWADDPTPIDPTTRRDDAGRVVCVDPRMEKLNRYLIQAELTQCTHRSRALREARTIVTLCLDDVEYLPATETVIDLPSLTITGLDAWEQRRKAERERIDQALRDFAEQGQTVHMVTVRALRVMAKCSTDAAAAALRRARREQDTHTHHLCSHSSSEIVPGEVIESSYSPAGTKNEESAARAPAPHRSLSRRELILRYGEAAHHPALILPEVIVESGAAAWAAFLQPIGGGTPEQWHAVYEYVREAPDWMWGTAGPPRLAG